MGYDDGRMIRKSISDSKKVAKLSPEALSLFCFLIPHFSSHGKMNGSPHYIKGEVCPRIEWLDVPTIIKCLREIHKHTSVKWFEHDGRLYLHSTNNDEHQNLQDYKKGTDRMPDVRFSLVARLSIRFQWLPFVPGLLLSVIHALNKKRMY